MFKPTYLDAVYDLLDNKVNGGPEAGPIAEISLHEGETAPTEETIQAKLAELISAYNAQEYARNRATEYPALTEQLDEIYHNGIDSWKAVIKVTKDKYPK
tara:strand:- start:696 stop:995 length:300 start_codon:yes stop_codon:yes gene_type:complete